VTDPSVQRFRRIIESAYSYLDSRRGEVNDLNVFPVADGDTGDNMALTMRAVLRELDRIEAEGNGAEDRVEVVHTVARAALMGARGNSGVILSQIVRGAAEELAARPGELVDPVLVSAAVASAADAAYESVRDPAEGTMLTVLRAMSHAAATHIAHLDAERQRLSESDAGSRQDEVLAEVIEVMIRSGEEAVLKTPDQLDALAEAGVVDAGAHGLVLILAGALAGLRGDEQGIVVAEQAPARSSVPHHTDSRYRFCVNFIVTGSDLDGSNSVDRLEELGDSVLVVGDAQTLKVHVHTDDPPAARAIFDGRGSVSNVDEADMREQVLAREERLAAAHSRTGVLAVVSGAGLGRLYEELGADVVAGGPTMNPSTDELLAGIHAVSAERVIVLPNSPNVVMAARTAAALSARDAVVVECTSQQAGLVAMVEVDPAAELAANEERLNQALAEIRVAGVAPAAKDDAAGRFVRGDAVGLRGEEVIAWGGAGSTLRATIEALAEGAEIVTIIEGEGAPIALGEVTTMAPDGLDVEAHAGGQPHYWWLLAVQ
jgi:hypothetical protein